MILEYNHCLKTNLLMLYFTQNIEMCWSVLRMSDHAVPQRCAILPYAGTYRSKRGICLAMQRNWSQISQQSICVLSFSGCSTADRPCFHHREPPSALHMRLQSKNPNILLAAKFDGSNIRANVDCIRRPSRTCSACLQKSARQHFS